MAYPLCLLYGYSMACSLVFSLSMVYPMPYPLAYPLPVFLSPPFPLVYRRYRYAIRLTRNGDYFV